MTIQNSKMMKKNIQMRSDDNDTFFETSKKIKNRINTFTHFLQGDIVKNEIPILKDITRDWVNFLKKDGSMKKNSFIKLNIAGRGGGKTANLFSESNILLRSNPKRVVQFWKTDPVIDVINKYCPKKLIGRYESINNLSEIKENSIFVIDEGVIGANAKEALKIEMRNLIKFLSKTRHYNIIGIINSVSLDILLQFKNMIDIVAYRRLPRSFLLNSKSKDYILKRYSDELTKLKDWQFILVSSYKRFQIEGIASMKYEIFCPWFNDDISMYQKATSADVGFDENQTQLEIHKKIALWTIDEVGDKFFVKSGFDLFSMWLYTNYNETYHNNKAELRTIYKLYKFLIIEILSEKEDSDDESNDFDYDEIDNIMIDVDYKKELEEENPDELGVFLAKKEVEPFVWDYDVKEVLDMIKKDNTRLKNIDRDYEILKLSYSGMDNKLISIKYRIKDSSVIRIVNNLKKLINYKKGKLLEEKYYAYLQELKKKNVFDNIDRLGNAGESDIMAYKNNIIFIFALKCRGTKDIVIDKYEYKVECDQATEIDRYGKQDKAYVFLVVFDTITDNFYEILVDHNHPKTININDFIKQ